MLNKMTAEENSLWSIEITIVLQLFKNKLSICTPHYSLIYFQIQIKMAKIANSEHKINDLECL